MMVTFGGIIYLGAELMKDDAESEMLLSVRKFNTAINQGHCYLCMLVFALPHPELSPFCFEGLAVCLEQPWFFKAVFHLLRTCWSASPTR